MKQVIRARLKISKQTKILTYLGVPMTGGDFEGWTAGPWSRGSKIVSRVGKLTPFLDR